MTALELLESQYLKEAEVAKFMGLTVKALRNRHSMGKNHPPCVAGCRPRKYRLDAFESWLRSTEKKQINKAS